MLLNGIGRSAAIGCVSLGVGDVIMQSIEYKNGELEEWNQWRTARFAIAGLTLHGPYFHLGFGKVEQIFGPSKTFRTALVKMGTSQVTLFPVYLSLLFPYLSLMEGKSFSMAIDKTKQVWWPTFVNGAIFWPAVNMINFTMVPPGSSRVFCVAFAGIVWNCYISYVNFNANKKQIP